MDLARCESEDEVEDILKEHDYWDDSNWILYGGIENNYSTIGNQQSNAEMSLCEKITNSIDAILVKECVSRGINPEGEEAPQSLREAIKLYFGIPEGKILNLGSSKRREEIAKNIFLTATGTAKNPNICVIDLGEGQHPDKFKDTLLSLSKSNKLRIPFVQGKNNMGSTGVFEFCGKKKIQLLISRRHPDIEGGRWGFTVIRKFPPEGNMKHSSYKYLAPNGRILEFSSESLPLLPGFVTGEGWKVMQDEMIGGTFIKLYNYTLSSGHRSDIRTNLHYRLATYLPDLGLPVTLIETRYKRRDASSILYGFHAKLREEREKIEEGFPLSFSISVMGEELKGTIYLFKRGEKKEMYDRASIIFSDNGQSQGSLTKHFFTRKSINLSYLKDDLAIIIDCTDMKQVGREALFMNSRDRLRNGEFKTEIEKKLEKILSEEKYLKELNYQRKQNDIQRAVKDSSNMEESMEKILAVYPDLARILQDGKQMSGGINLNRAETIIRIPDLREFPSFFELGKKKKFSIKIGKKEVRINLKTDAQNDYFSRSKSPGTFKLFTISMNGNNLPLELSHGHSISLSNGNAVLRISIPNKEGTIGFRYEVSDVKNINGFSDVFEVEIKNKPPREPKSAGNKSDKFNLPEIVMVDRRSWKEHNFTESTGAKLRGTKDEGYVVYVNSHNRYLLSALGGKKQDGIVEVYSTSMAIFALLIVNYVMTKGEDANYENAYKMVEMVTEAITPGLIPHLLQSNIG